MGIGRKHSDQAADSHVLHDGGIHSRRDERAQELFRLRHFIGKDQGVEGDITLDPAAVEELHQAGQIGLREILRAHPGVEPVQAEVNGIGPIFHGGLDAFPVTGGSEQLGGIANCGWRMADGGLHGILNVECRIRKWGCFHFTILYSQYTIFLAVLAAIKPDDNRSAGERPVGL